VQQGRDQNLVSIGRAAELLGVSVPTLRRWTASGRISGELTPGGHRRYRLDELRRLREAAVSQTAPRLRDPVMPEEATPAFANVLESRGFELVSAAAHHLYAQNSVGWFGSSVADPSLLRWIQSLTAACRAGAYPAAINSTVEVSREALLGGFGVTVRECLVFLEIFGTMVTRELGTHPETRDARRLVSALRFAPLEVSLFDHERQREAGPSDADRSEEPTPGLPWPRGAAA
jgi:excisionase family DNA binding protein